MPGKRFVRPIYAEIKLFFFDLEISQEIHCFYEHFMKASARVVVFPRDLMHFCNAIFLGFTGVEIHSFAKQCLRVYGPRLSVPQSHWCRQIVSK